MRLRLFLSLFAVAGLLLAGCEREPAEPSELGGDSRDARPLAEKIEALRLALGAPGVAMGVYRGGDAVLEAGFGSKSALPGGDAAPPGPETVFRVGSVTKMFVAALALRLERDGAWSLDDPAARHLPPGLPSLPGGDAITLRMLGSHAGGLFNHVGSREARDAFAAEPARVWTEAELLAPALAREPDFAPGEKCKYSNTGYILLGLAAERAAGRPLAGALRERIFGPIGLARTDYPLSTALPAGDVARGHNLGGAAGPSLWRGRGAVLHDTTETSPAIWHAAGAMTSCLADLRVFVRAVARGELATPEQFRRQTEWVPTGRDDGLEAGFGLFRFEGGWLGHGGQVPGYQCVAAHHPPTDTTVVVLTNLYADAQNRTPADALFTLIVRHLESRPPWLHQARRAGDDL